MYQGKCQGCDAHGEVDDIMLCDRCAEYLEKSDQKLREEVELSIKK